MSFTRFATSALALALSALPADAEDKPAAKDVDWKKLFDGKTLDGWKSSFTSGSGKVQVKDGAIVLEKGQKMTGMTYTGKDFPTTDYEVVLEGKRVDGRDFFATTTFPVGDGFCSLVVGGWGGMVTGISSINGADASENETTSSKEFRSGEWYKIRIRVSEKKVEAWIGVGRMDANPGMAAAIGYALKAWIGDEQMVDVERKSKKFNTRIECEDCQPFGVCTWDTTGAVRDVRVRKLSDEEKKAGAKK